MHAPSVGEGLQARPVLAAVRAARPALQIAYTFYSPSADAFAAGLARDRLADFADYLPFDTARDADAALDALTPSALVFSKLDVWPTLVARAAARRIPLGLVSATLAADSSRRGPLARTLLRDAYARLDAVGAVSDDDAARLVAIGVRAPTITVTGDARFDQVWARARATETRVVARLATGRATLVAGSTWPSDDRVVLPAWRAADGSLRLIIAPHEPSADHVAAIARRATDAGRRVARIDDDDAPAADVVVVDRLGVLGDLYALASIAFVGGAFHAAGLHSTLEPAAYGVPVLFGPRHAGSRDAALLLAAGAAHAVDGPSAMTTRINAWVRDDAARCAAGAQARDVVRRGLGAADRSATLVARLLDRSGATD